MRVPSGKPVLLQVYVVHRLRRSKGLWEESIGWGPRYSQRRYRDETGRRAPLWTLSAEVRKSEFPLVYGLKEFVNGPRFKASNLTLRVSLISRWPPVDAIQEVVARLHLGETNDGVVLIHGHREEQRIVLVEGLDSAGRVVRFDANCTSGAHSPRLGLGCLCVLCVFHDTKWGELLPAIPCQGAPIRPA